MRTRAQVTPCISPFGTVDCDHPVAATFKVKFSDAAGNPNPRQHHTAQYHAMRALSQSFTNLDFACGAVEGV
jgi:hypothetical protein